MIGSSFHGGSETMCIHSNSPDFFVNRPSKEIWKNLNLPNMCMQDKAYAKDKLKALYAELSFSRSKVQCDIPKLREELQTATGSPRDEGRGGDGSNAAQAYGKTCTHKHPHPTQCNHFTLICAHLHAHGLIILLACIVT